MRKNTNLWLILGVFYSGILQAETLESTATTSRSFALSLPLLMDTPFSVEYNLGRGMVGLAWTPIRRYQMLTEQDLKTNPNQSLQLRGQEIGITTGRFQHEATMSGFYWGLGAGYRKTQGEWIKSASNTPNGALQNHDIKVEGTTFSGKVGYRYAGESYGFLGGIFILLRHFDNHVTDASQGENTPYVETSYEDKASLKRLVMTSLHPGLELGWAF